MTQETIPDIEAVMQEYGAKVYNIAFHILGNHHDAEDAVQETFLSVHQNLHAFRGESRLYTWIYRIAVNQALKMVKKGHSKIIQRSLDDSIQRDNQPLPEDWGADLPSALRKIFLDELVHEIRQKCHYFVTFRLTEE
jgi:RNA polymerase sigma-70 factor (ECF subfamily)